MKARLWISAAAIILLVAGGIYVFRDTSKPKTQSGTASTAAAVQPVYAVTGQVVDTFPKDLVMGGNNVTQTSYKVSYANSSQNTAVYDTTDTVATVYQDYLSYLKKNSYDLINNQISAKADSAQIFAIGPNGSVSVRIDTLGAKAHVSTTYLKQ